MWPFHLRIVTISLFFYFAGYISADMTVPELEEIKFKHDSNESTEFVPIELCDLGYFEGEWNKFCDNKSIDEEFSYFPQHELKNLRNLLCHMWKENKFNYHFRSTSAIYKYCAIMRYRVDKFIQEFVKKFSMNNTERQREMVAETDIYKNNTCYETSVKEFEKKCIAHENPYSAMFGQIFSYACTYKELTIEDILSTIEEVCRGQFMREDIDFKPYLLSIGFRTSSKEYL